MIRTLEELRARRNNNIQYDKGISRRIYVCADSGCVANGSLDVYNELLHYAEQVNLPVIVSLKQKEEMTRDLPIYVTKSGCHGFCQMAPLVHIVPDDIFYCKVKVEDASQIIEKTIIHNEIIPNLLYHDPITKKSHRGRADIPFYTGQTRLVLRRCGEVDPESLDAYIATGGFKALEKALETMTPTEVLTEVENAGLRGRGGAGFLTGLKWRLCVESPGDEKYIICNGDEGDPGAFMDRSIMEGDPFQVLEGLLIAGYAIRAKNAIIYVRQEYPLAVIRLMNAIQCLHTEGLLGEKILDFGFNFDITIKKGAGAFVCGEETALIQSIEGKRGMPRPRPPYPTTSGLYGKPTVINNVETFANLESIILRGASWYNSIGTKTSKGTKVFAVTGKINNTGLVEVAMGTTIRQIIFDIGQGIPNNKKFKAVQTGGPSGGCIDESNINLPIDYESLKSAGAIMGSGGMVVMDESTCMVDIARYFINFCAEESCGKCVPCREGLFHLELILEKITEGRGETGDLKKIEELCDLIEKDSLCSLGQTAINSVKSSLRYFRDEYRTHIEEKHCPAGVCKALISFQITDKCTGCEVCKRNCPVNCIKGDRKQRHVIDGEICIRCGTCKAICAFDAIITE